MGEEMYFELAKRSVPIVKNETARLSWRNSVLTVCSSKRVNFLEYAYNLECLERTLDFKESSIVSPKDSPATEVCDRKFLKSEMRSVDYTEMIVNPSFWPHNPSLTQEMTSITMCKWSPINFLKGQCVLAILNNVGGVEFFIQHKIEWKSVLNLSPYVLKVLQYNKAPVYFDELKESVYIIETSAICWAHDLNTDNSCYFVTAQKSGMILIWQVFNNLNTVKIKGRIETKLTDITSVKWIPKSDNKFFLICTNILGQINAFDIEVENGGVKLVRNNAFWPHKDRIMAGNLKFMNIDNHLIFICSKHRHLLIQIIGNDGKVLSQYLNNVNDYRITGIAYTIEGIYLCTVNVKIYKVNIAIENGNLNVNLTQVYLKEPYTTFELYGIRFSANNAICALVMVNRRVLCRKQLHKMELIFVTKESNLESALQLLVNNPSNKLTHHWDCVELLRYQIMKLKIIPKFDYNELYTQGLQDAYKLKVYLILQTFLTGLKKVLRVYSSANLPETSSEVVKEKLLYLHAQKLLKKLCDKCQKDGMLSDLDMESLYGSKNYLEYYAKKYKTTIELDKNVLNALENKCEYVCQCCDDKIEGFSCKKGHLNMFCVATFTPILNDDYLLCPCCNSTTRTDLEIINPLCVICDLNLVKPD